MSTIYSVTVPLHTKKSLFGIPKTNEYALITIPSLPKTVITDVTWQNKVGYFETEDSFSFQVSPKKIAKKIPKKLSVSSYVPDSALRQKSNRFINPAHPGIQALVSDLSPEMPLNTIIKTLYFRVIDRLEYGSPIEGLYTTDEALKRQNTDCGGFSVVLISALSAMKIPSRLAVGFFLLSGKKQKLNAQIMRKSIPITESSLAMHVWVEAELPDHTFFPLDPATEYRRIHNLSKRSGGYGKIAADRFVVSYGCDFPLLLNGKLINIDILQHPIAVK